jgi:hypothetical protein
MTMTVKVKKFAEWVKARKDKVLSLSVTYYDEALIWRPSCAIVWGKSTSIREIHLNQPIEDALAWVKGGRAHVVFSDKGEVTLRLRR